MHTETIDTHTTAKDVEFQSLTIRHTELLCERCHDSGRVLERAGTGLGWRDCPDCPTCDNAADPACRNPRLADWDAHAEILRAYDGIPYRARVCSDCLARLVSGSLPVVSVVHATLRSAPL